MILSGFVQFNSIFATISSRGERIYLRQYRKWEWICRFYGCSCTHSTFSLELRGGPRNFKALHAAVDIPSHICLEFLVHFEHLPTC